MPYVCQKIMKAYELPKLGIIAGSGNLPREIVKICQEEGRPFLILAYAGQTDPETYLSFPHIMGHLGKVGEAIQNLKQAQVKELVLAGRFRRPSWVEIKPDAVCARWLARSARNIFGDDSLLKTIVQNLEEEGFRVVGAEDIIGCNLLAPKGVLGQHLPTDQAMADVRHGFTVAKILGRCDIGQAVVVQQGMVLGVEAIEGTDQLLLRSQALKREGSAGVLVKVIKPRQERRVDRPLVGPQTVHCAVKAGLGGIALETGEIIVHNLPEMIQLADKNGLFLMSVTSEDCASPFTDVDSISEEFQKRERSEELKSKSV